LLCMELIDGLESIHVGCWFPARFIVAFPLEKVL
jgi:hypothetical protein